MGLTQLITDLQGVNIYTNMRFLAFISWCKSLIGKKRTGEEEPLLPSPPRSPPSEPKKFKHSPVCRRRQCTRTNE